VKNLDGKCAKENDLKEALKETLETLAIPSHAIVAEDEEPEVTASIGKTDFFSSGDEELFCKEKENVSKEDSSLLKEISSAIGSRIRLRRIPDPDRAPDVAEYSMATVTGWKMANAPQNDTLEGEAIPATQATLPVWRLGLDDGGEIDVSASEAVEGIVRAIKWSTGHLGYVEHDAPFLSYRNSLGRFCGRAVEAPSSLTPQAFAKQLIKREQDLYMPLKNRTFENNWGGKAGARQVWVSSLKECGHTFEAVREGLLTLENAFFDLTGGLCSVEEKVVDELATESNGGTPDASAAQSNGGALSGKDLLYDHTSRFDIELESLGSDVKGIWNSSDAREIFQEIIGVSKTVSVLALGLDLICRNAQAYINQTKSSVVQPINTDQASGAYVGRRRAAKRPGAYADFF